jgi:hypothetical protein
VLHRADRVLGPASPASRVRELAIRGAQAFADDHTRRAELMERLVARMATPGWMGMTPDEIDRGAWGFERD